MASSTALSSSAVVEAGTGVAEPFESIWSGEAVLSGSVSSGRACLVVVETGESAATDGAAEGTALVVVVDVDRDNTVMLGLTESDFLASVAEAPGTGVDDEDDDVVAAAAAAAALADLEAAKTDAEGVANGVLTLTTGEAVADRSDPVAAAEGAGKVVKVGFDKLDRLNTFALRLIGG